MPRLTHAAAGLLWLGGLGLAAQSVQVDLSAFFNHKAFGASSNETVFDTTYNRSFPPLNHLAPDGVYTSSQTGIRYSFPSYTGPSSPDNLICEGQTIPIPSGNGSTAAARPFSLNMLVANDLRDAIVSYNLTYVYADGTTALAELRALSFFSWLTATHGEIISPFTWTPEGRDWNTSQIFEFTGSLDPTKTLAAVQLPVANNATVGRIHVFSLSVWSGETPRGPSVEVQSVRPTQKWTEAGHQVVEVTLNNVGSECVSGPGLSVSLEGPGLTTVESASLRRLCAGDQKRVNVGVTGSAANTTAQVVLSSAGSNATQTTTKTTTTFPGLTFGLANYTADLDSLARHESPQWFDDAKFGIMIHWGPYAVPAYGGVAPNETYAEWFWWYTANGHAAGSDKSDSLAHRLAAFGPDWDYDDGFPGFTASAWDPRAWVDLFADAGARYFVLTTKHHDGFALFDAGATSNRSSLHHGPRRDVVRELFDAAALYQPDMRRGTYFSLPEWYNPDFGPYGFSQYDTAGSTNWLGIPATNPFTNLTEPYTGHVPVGDFVADVQRPQMETLAYEYGSDIMWCDCGTANDTAAFAAAWWNWARFHAEGSGGGGQEDSAGMGIGRQVVLNSRCGVAQAADFETPEYATYSSAQRHKWESNRGMDPYSYGYNAATPDGAYMNASTVVYTLVDIVAKNGNFLLDVGPTADGTIVEAEAAALRDAGRWIRGHAEAVFGTTYWFVQTQIAGSTSSGSSGAGQQVEVRFTQTEDAFYVLFLGEAPVVGADGYVWVNATVPVLEGDTVSLLGVNATGAEDLAWKTSDEGYLAVSVGGDLLALEEYCWVFKIAYAE